MKIFKICIERVFWLSIFLSPFITGLLVALALFVDGYTLLAYAILGIAAISGILFAENVRKRYGCSHFMSELFHHKAGKKA